MDLDLLWEFMCLDAGCLVGDRIDFRGSKTHRLLRRSGVAFLGRFRI